MKRITRMSYFDLAVLAILIGILLGIAASLGESLVRDAITCLTSEAAQAAADALNGGSDGSG